MKRMTNLVLGGSDVAMATNSMHSCENREGYLYASVVVDAPSQCATTGYLPMKG